MEKKIGLFIGRNLLTETILEEVQMLKLLYKDITVVQSLSYVGLFVTPWTTAYQVSLSLTIAWSVLKLMSIE